MAEAEELAVPSSIEGDDFLIPIKVHLPSSADKIRAAVFFIHGGIFTLYDRHSHPTISSGLADLGLAVVTATFRCGKDAPHSTGVAMRDLKDVIDYVRGRWSDVPFGLVGSSSGGFFALTLSQTLGPSVVSFCVPICPVAHPYKRAVYLRSCIAGTAIAPGGYIYCHDKDRATYTLEKQMGYWEDDDSMIEAGDFLNSPSHDVPTLMILGSVDKNIPYEVVDRVKSWATRTVVVGGRGHELCNEVVKGGGYHCYLPDVERFIEHCCLASRKGE